MHIFTDVYAKDFLMLLFSLIKCMLYVSIFYSIKEVF